MTNIFYLWCVTKVLTAFGLPAFKNQVINTILHTETLHHLSEWQNMPPISAHGPIVNPPFHIELVMDQNTHVQYLTMQSQNNEYRHITIRYYLYSLHIH